MEMWYVLKIVLSIQKFNEDCSLEIKNKVNNLIYMYDLN